MEQIFQSKSSTIPSVRLTYLSILTGQICEEQQPSFQILCQRPATRNIQNCVVRFDRYQEGLE